MGLGVKIINKPEHKYDLRSSDKYLLTSRVRYQPKFINNASNKVKSM
jgi:hypothetical protein